MYDVALWNSYKVASINKLRSSFNKCIKLFFGMKRRDSMSDIMIQLGLPSLNTLLSNGAYSLKKQMFACNNLLIRQLLRLQLV